MIRDAARTVVLQALRNVPVEPYEPAERRLWLLRPDHLGDLLFLRPALARLRTRLPDWHITLAVGPWSGAVMADDTNVDEIVELRFPGFERSASGNPAAPYKVLFAEAQRLRAARPVAVIVLRDDHWWGALLGRRAGSPLIIGAWHEEMRGLLTDSLPLKGCHSVERNIELVEFTAAKLGSTAAAAPATPENDPLRWAVTDDDRAAARTLLRSIGMDAPYAVIHPGSGAPVKLWPVDRWARVARNLRALGLGIVLTGSNAERVSVEEITVAANGAARSLAGKTTVRTLAALFEGAQIVAGVDSGPLHLAVAVGSPTVHLFGPSGARRFGPWGDPSSHRVVTAGMCCGSCGDLSLIRPEGAGCMIAIQENDVIDVLRELLDR